MGCAFNGLDGYIAYEAVAYGYVGVAVEEVAAFDVACEVDVGEGAEEGKCVACEGVALGVFFADVEETYSRTADSQDVLRVHVSHDGELNKIVRITVYIRAYVEEERWNAVDGGQDGGECWTVDAGEHAQDHFCGGHGGPGVSGGEEGGGAAFANHPEADPHGGVALGADGLCGFIVHGDPLAGGDDEDGKALASEGLAEDGAQGVFRADKVDSDVVLTCSENSPANLRFGGFVGTHCIDNDVGRHQEEGLSVRC